MSNPNMTDNERVGHYVEMWKQTVTVQQHFNDIEWRIRGLALTVATFALGAAGVAAKDGATLGGVSLGSLVIFVGLLLWYAFYFVDKAWYHPLLKAAVAHGTKLESTISKEVNFAGLTAEISAGSPFTPTRFVQFLSRTNGPMRSDDKLNWFYTVGAVALLVAGIGLQVSAWTSTTVVKPGPQIVVNVDTGRSGSSSVSGGSATPSPTISPTRPRPTASLTP